MGKDVKVLGYWPSPFVMRPICESLIIVEYIDETFSSAPSILPSDAYECAIQRFWAAYMDNNWFPILHEVVDAVNEETTAAAIEKVKEGLELFEEAFNKCSKGKPFFSGDKLGYLDIVFGSFVGWLHAVGKMNNLQLLSPEKTPSLLAWADKFCAHDAIKDYMPETEKLIEVAELMKAGPVAAASTAANTQS